MDKYYNLCSFTLIIIGSLLAYFAFRALGFYPTYFGVELGHLKAKRITSFPYNLNIPHPMIIGDILALLGILIITSSNYVYSIITIIHIVLYIIHLLQEQFQIIH